MPFDHSGLEVLDARQCRALLEHAVIGRIVYTDHALPAIQPVNFALNDDNVVIRTSHASGLAAASRGTIVAFETDEFDAAARIGWSVVVVGRARVVTAPDELAALESLPLDTWAATGEEDHYISIRPELVSGRRIPATHDLPAARS